MNVFLIIAGLYPGLAGLTRFSRWCYLVIALLFAFCLDLTVLVNWYWIDLIAAPWKKWTWVALFVCWSLLSFLSNRLSRAMENRRKLDAKGDLYLEALTHYLKGNWQGATDCAKTLLRYNSEDVEALLLLATLYRHTRALFEAKETLVRLDKLEAADKWYYEIMLEKRELRLLLADTAESSLPEELEESPLEESLILVVPESSSTEVPSLRLVRAEDGLSIPVDDSIMPQHHSFHSQCSEG